jgi:23S rRNA (uridine2552-2'-O)-methyltransferase
VKREKKRPSQKNTWDDHYSRKARKENYSARSVYKLEEIQNKYHLIKKGYHILDLGCAPGSWLQYAAGLAGNGGRVVGIDKKPVSLKLPSHVTVYQGDVLSIDALMADEPPRSFDAVLSDMAPATTGNKSVDAARSLDLCMAAFSLAKKYLKPGGSFVCKVFQGEDFKLFSDSIRTCFKIHKIFKPQSSRKASREIYVIGRDKKQEEECPDTASGQP